MRTLFSVAFLGTTLLAQPVSGKRIAIPPLPDRVGRADAILTGKVTAFEEKKIKLSAPDEFKLEAIWEVLQGKMVRRKVPLKNLDRGKAEPAAGASMRQEIALKDGLTADQAREIARTIKDAKLKKVQAAIQGDTVRISSPDKDALQGVIAMLKQQDFGVELTFGNYRTN